MKFAYSYAIFDSILIAICVFMGEFWLINSQLAFISCMMILFASFISNRKLIMKKSADFDLKLLEKEDKICIKKTSKMLGFGASLSLLRLASYLLLVLVFLYLNRHGILQITPFLLGISTCVVANIVAAIFNFKDFNAN